MYMDTIYKHITIVVAAVAALRYLVGPLGAHGAAWDHLWPSYKYLTSADHLGSTATSLWLEYE